MVLVFIGPVCRHEVHRLLVGRVPQGVPRARPLDAAGGVSFIPALSVACIVSEVVPQIAGDAEQEHYAQDNQYAQQYAHRTVLLEAALLSTGLSLTAAAAMFTGRVEP